MPTDTELISQVWTLYVTVLNQAAILDNYYPSVHHWYSACNLLAFLTYKNQMNSETISALRMRGFRLSSIQHVAQSLQIMCSNLGIVPPLPFKYDEGPARLAKIRRQKILGVQFHEVSPHIMLTLDAKMISSPNIEQYLASGMTIARINCAYGETTWANMIEAVRRAEDQLRKKGQYDHQSCKIYMDLAGPKIRVRRIHRVEENLVKAQLKKSDLLRIYLTDTVELQHAYPSSTLGISVSLPEAFVHIKEGHSVFIDDGKIHGKVKGYNGEFVDVEIVSPEKPITLKENKGLNLPDSNVSWSVPALTTKDEKDLAFICRHADLVGFSFVNHPDDLQKLKPYLSYYGKSDLPVIAKIETKQAVHNFSKILLEGLTFSNFGVMVARGDLAIELGFQQLPVVQEEILAMCRAAHIPVILATQVLDTLAKKGIPSRPELADLSFGSEFDCVMLNKGPFMKETVGFAKETLFLISQFKDHKYGVTRPNDL